MARLAVAQAAMGEDAYEQPDSPMVGDSGLLNTMQEIETNRQQESERDGLMRELNILETQMVSLEHQEQLKEFVLEVLRDDVESLSGANAQMRTQRTQAEGLGRDTEAEYRQHLLQHSTHSKDLVTKLMEACPTQKYASPSEVERCLREAHALLNGREQAQHQLNLEHASTKQQLAALEDELATLYQSSVKQDGVEHVAQMKRLLKHCGLSEAAEGEDPEDDIQLLPESQVEEIAKLRCKLAANTMARRTSVMELSVAQVRVEQMLSMLGDELQKCPEGAEDTTEEIEGDCERLLAVHEQLHNYLIAVEKGDEAAAAEWLDTNHRQGAGVPGDEERDALSQEVKELFEQASKEAQELENAHHEGGKIQTEVMRLGGRCRRWKERSQLEVRARKSATAELQQRESQLKAMKAKFLTEEEGDNASKLKVLDALLSLVASGAPENGDFVPMNLSMEDLDNALKGSTMV